MNRVLKKISKELSQIDDVRAIILYGSFARNEATSRSDIDLFVLTTDNKTTKEVQEKVIDLETDIDRNIQPTVRTIKQLQKTDTGLLQNIFQEGKVIYLKEPAEIPSAVLLKQKPHLIYSFQITNLAQKDKAKFNNSFYGRTKDKYDYPGFLYKIGGEKLSSGCVMIPYANKSEIDKYFKKHKVKFQLAKIWK